MINKNFISTYSKMRFNPTSPNYENILIKDIAHALSLMVRANGHFRTFYSVAQHCIACCKEARLLGYSDFVQLTCLLHDASEAYISDITRPLKRQLNDYTLYEKNLEEIIYKKFLKRLPNEYEHLLVKDIDNVMLYHEFKIFHGDLLYDYEPDILYHIENKFIDFQVVENEYISIFNELITKI